MENRRTSNRRKTIMHDSGRIAGHRLTPGFPTRKCSNTTQTNQKKQTQRDLTLIIFCFGLGSNIVRTEEGCVTRRSHLRLTHDDELSHLLRPVGQGTTARGRGQLYRWSMQRVGITRRGYHSFTPGVAHVVNHFSPRYFPWEGWPKHHTVSNSQYYQDLNF